MTSGQRGSWRGLKYVEWNGLNRNLDPNADRLLPNDYYKWSFHRANPSWDPWTHTYTSMDGKLVTKALIRYFWPNVYAGLQNFVVRKLVEAVSQQQYLADLYEAKSAVDIVTVKLAQVLKLTRKLKKLPAALLKFKGKPAGAVVLKPKEIRGKGPRRNRKKPKGVDLSVVPAEWLTYWFGIAPTVGSVSGLAETFNVPFDPVPVRGKSPKSSFNYGDSTVQAQVSFRCLLQIENPNVGIINRMGLKNFVSTAWELAPWSWAVDYFGNMGELFANFDGLFKNVNMSRDSWTWFITSQWRTPNWPPGSPDEVGVGFNMERHRTLPTVYLPELNIDLSLQRVSYLLSAISLTLKGKLS